VRKLPCFVCVRSFYMGLLANPALWPFILEAIEGIGPNEQQSATEAAHLGRSASKRGLSQKYPDREAGPLCGTAHHREGRESIHKLGPKFWERHGWDRDEVIDLMNGLYRSQEKNA